MKQQQPENLLEQDVQEYVNEHPNVSIAEAYRDGRITDPTDREILAAGRSIGKHHARTVKKNHEPVLYCPSCLVFFDSWTEANKHVVEQLLDAMAFERQL